MNKYGKRASLTGLPDLQQVFMTIAHEPVKVKLKVNPYSQDPNMAWEMIKSRRTVKPVRPMKIDTPIKPEAVRFVCISDTHSRLFDPDYVPKGDVLIVAGDFTTCGSPEEVRTFTNFLDQLPHTYKIVIAGNHELTFDPNFKSSRFEKSFQVSAKELNLRQKLQEALAREKISNPRSLLKKNCIYLEDSSVEIFGLTIYGAPWLPCFDNWAFNLPRGQALLDKWNKIPSAIDVLVTHAPPLGYGDLISNGVRGGCVELSNSVCKRIRPKYHVFGHIHEGYGCTTDGYTKFINACICDTKMLPTNLPVLFDITLPVGITKKSGEKTKPKFNRRNSVL